MSLISATESASTIWDPIQDATLDLRNGCAALERSLEQIFQEVDEMRQELVDRLQEVEHERLQLDSREVEVGQQSEDVEQQRGELQQQANELVQAREELARFKEELEQERNAAISIKESDDTQLRDELIQARAEVAQLKEELVQERAAATAAQKVGDAEVRDELISLRALLESQQQELSATRQERDELQQRVDASQSDSARLGSLEGELAETRQRLAEVNAGPRPAAEFAAADCAMTMSVEQMSELAQEREALEAELEIVRGRAAELNETVEEQQREINEQKSELSGELQQLRQLVEKQADLFADRDDERWRPAEAEPSPAAEQSQPSDPVVSSVMAQFAKLQKDVAQRRRHRQ